MNKISKLALWIFGFVLLSLLVVGVNYDYIYNPYTGKRDRSISLNQTGNNITADNFIGNLSADNTYNISDIEELNNTLRDDFQTNESILYGQNSSGDLNVLSITDENILELSIDAVKSDLWEIIQNEIRLVNPYNVNLSRNLTADFIIARDDLVVLDESSIIIGGYVNGSPFSKISAEEIINPAVPTAKRTTVNVDRDLSSVYNVTNGTVFLFAQNLDNQPYSNSVIDAVNADGIPMAMVKRGANYSEPHKSEFIGLGGHMDILNGPLATVATSPNASTMAFGFYEDLILKDDNSWDDFVNITRIIFISTENMSINLTTTFNESVNMTNFLTVGDPLVFYVNSSDTTTGDGSGAHSHIIDGGASNAVCLRIRKAGSPEWSICQNGNSQNLAFISHDSGGGDVLVLDDNGNASFGGDLGVNGNLSIIDRIIFGFGEFIDNVVDGWLRIFGNLEVEGNVNITGELNVSGNFTGNQYYGEMWNQSPNDTAWNFDVDVASIYYNMTGLSEGKLNGFTYYGNSTETGGSYLEVNVAGRYKVDTAISFEGMAQGRLYSFVSSKNFNVDLSRNCYSRRYVSALSVVGSASTSCILDLDVGDTLNLQVEAEGTAGDIHIHAINLNTWRIGD
jgi:hypothetical protein